MELNAKQTPIAKNAEVPANHSRAPRMTQNDLYCMLLTPKALKVSAEVPANHSMAQGRPGMICIVCC